MKKIKLFAFVAMSALLAVSCVDDDTNDLGGGDTNIVGFLSRSAAASYVTAPDTVAYNIPVRVIGGNHGLYPNADVTVTYEVVSVATDTLQANEGEMWDFTDANHSVVIPAGSNFTSIPLTIYTGNLVDRESRTVTLKLTTVTSQDNVMIATNYDTVVVSLTGICFSNLAGSYTVNYTSGAFPVTITELGPGSYMSSVTPGYTQYEMYFTDLCGDLTITDWYANSQYPISGTGTVNPANGNLAWTGVTITGIYANRNYTFVRN